MELLYLLSHIVIFKNKLFVKFPISFVRSPKFSIIQADNALFCLPPNVILIS